MLNEYKLNNVNNSAVVSYNDLKTIQEPLYSDKSIFAEESSPDEGLTLLNQQLDVIEDEQGCFSKAWNKVKETVGLGTSVEKCEDYIEQYKNGDITYEEAAQKLAEFDSKQDSSLNLFSNIASSVLSIAAVAAAAAIAVSSGGLALPAAIAIGAATGAVAKSGMKTIDRATNEVEGDAGDVKTIAKDALSGAVTGGIATATMGTASGAKTVKDAVINCAKTGVKTGAVSGAANYTIDCTFEDDKDFKFSEMLTTTAANAAVGGVVGGIMGGANGSMHSGNILNSGCNLGTMVKGNANIVKDAAANSVCTSEYKILNDRIKAAVA